SKVPGDVVQLRANCRPLSFTPSSLKVNPLVPGAISVPLSCLRSLRISVSDSPSRAKVPLKVLGLPPLTAVQVKLPSPRISRLMLAPLPNVADQVPTPLKA